MNGTDRSSVDPWWFPAGTLGSTGSRGDSTQGESTDGTRSSPPAISVPKGRGAIRGMAERFSTNPVTGTGSLSFPLYTSSGRSGFGSLLSLSYDSRAGNGAFGWGWSLSLSTITCKTDKGLLSIETPKNPIASPCPRRKTWCQCWSSPAGRTVVSSVIGNYGFTVLWSSASAALPHCDRR
jgi:hypothetical protein